MGEIKGEDLMKKEREREYSLLFVVKKIVYSTTIDLLNKQIFLIRVEY